MGHYCRVCDRERSNEAFTGRGHRNHVCKQCQRLPHDQRRKIEHLDELAHFLSQSNISARNLHRIGVLTKSADPEVRDWAAAIMEVAGRFPRKRRRYVRMMREQPDLLRRLRQLLGDAWWEDLIVGGALGRGTERWATEDRFEGGAATRPPEDLLVEPPRLAVARPSRVHPSMTRPSTHEFRSGLKRVTIHTDGACQHNPGPGGWAAILRYGAHVKELKGAESSTTNNRMELQAALSALRALKQPCAVELITDSKYLRDGVTRWMMRWKANGWKTVERASVKNRDLWEQLDAQCARHQVAWRWVKGHRGHPDNERCDELARAELGFPARNQAHTLAATPTRQCPPGSPATVEGRSQGEGGGNSSAVAEANLPRPPLTPPKPSINRPSAASHASRQR